MLPPVFARDGANENRITGNLIAATYRHASSRELDPQLHTHAVTANLTYDGVEGRWKALQASDLYERRAYLTEVYRNSLAHEVRRLGYDIDPKRDSRVRITDLRFVAQAMDSWSDTANAACSGMRQSTEATGATVAR